MNSQDRSHMGRGGFIWAESKLPNAYSGWMEQCILRLEQCILAV